MASGTRAALQENTDRATAKKEAVPAFPRKPAENHPRRKFSSDKQSQHSIVAGRSARGRQCNRHETAKSVVIFDFAHDAWQGYRTVVRFEP
jgi:hypothetical protein